ncbi:MAG: zinc ABC transporter substrate-binding protein [bacterium]
MTGTGGHDAGVFVRRPLVLLAAVLALSGPGCGGRNPRPVVVGTTANITAVVAAVAGDRVENVTLAPAGMCPGHFDVRPSHVAAAARADLIIRQGWEEWFDDLARSLPEPRPRVVTAATGGNWMLPEVHRLAVLELAGLLAGLDTALADTFKLNAGRYLARVDSASRAARALLAGRSLPTAIAAEHQAPLLRWLGFRVVATYGRPEDFTARELSRLARVGIDSAVGLVADNLQSGPDAGGPLAAAFGARHVNLTNFPLEDDYPATLLESARTIARLLE